MKYFLIVVAILLYKFLLNLARFIELSKYQDQYYKWLNGSEIHLDLVSSRNRVKSLIKNALGNLNVPYIANMGYGQMASYQVPLFSLYPTNVVDYAKTMLESFEEALGIYRTHMFETFNPFFWINSLIFLPQKIFQYLGVPSQSVLIKLLQIIWWFATPVAIIFRDRLYQYILTIL
nr:hypothetical protein [uncultured Aminipila sp.]